MQSCVTCIHCVEATPQGQIVPVKFCTRNPPVMVGTPNGIASIQPGLPPTMVCGEYKGSAAHEDESPIKALGKLLTK